MQRSWSLKLLVAAMLVGVVGSFGCSSREHPAHAHNHEYRHGYYNPVDGYFHDDHWHNSARSRHYNGPYPARARSVSYHEDHPRSTPYRTSTYHYW